MEPRPHRTHSRRARPTHLAVLVALSAAVGCTASAVSSDAVGGAGTSTMEASSTTGIPGPCDGKAPGEECAPATCVDGAELGVARCDAAGGCAPSSTRSCGFYACERGTASCLLACAASADCAPGAFCENDACQPGRAPGETCVTQEECASRACVDGVCCATPCDGVCEACSAAKKGLGGGVDGECGPILLDTDPDAECTSEPTSTCGNAGACDGDGACALHPTGTTCLGTVCFDESTVQSPSACDGAGTCTAGATQACPGNLRCSADACLGNCLGDSGRCAPNFQCVFDGNDFICIAA